jgi:hypothetical protein
MHYKYPRSQLLPAAALVIIGLGFGFKEKAIAEDLSKFIVSGTQDQHGLGLVRDEPKQYRALKEVPRFRAFFPAAWDLSTLLPPPGDQGRQGSCVAWAVGYAARSYYLKRDFNADTSQAVNVLSPAFIYNTLSRGDCSGGLSISAALNLVREKGGVPLNQLPYNSGDCLALPEPSTIERYGPRFKIKGYRRVEAANQDDIKGQLYNGNPVIFAIDIPAQFEHYSVFSGVIDDAVDRGENFGHAMVITGYDDSKQAYHFVNSWGTHWGEHGFGWLSYRAAAALWGGGYVMDVEKPPAPEPPPNPLPPPPVPPAPRPAPTPQPGPPSSDYNPACSHLSTQTMPVDGGYRVTVSGFVATDEALQKIRSIYLSIPNVKALNYDGVAVRPWPQCEALLTLEASLANARGASVTRVPNSGKVLNGDHLVFELRSPDYASYVYVAYLQADGTAVHLIRPTTETLTPPNTLLRLGEEGDQKRFKVSEPFGHEMVILVASDEPLIDPNLVGPVRERDLLTAYRRLLIGPERKRASAAFFTLDTFQN